MKHFVRSGFLVVLTTLASATPTLAPLGTHACERANRAMLLASQRQADADFWEHVARCLADPESSLPCELKIAYGELRTANTLATKVFHARQSACALLGHVDYAPKIVASQFSPSITNTYFPQIPGRTLVREKQTAEGLERIEIKTTNETKRIEGVLCRVVRERETVDGVLVENTYDWVAQHQSGAVWNFGELAMSFEDGTLDSTDGSWHVGKDGAKPGVLMEAAPEVGDVYRQEFLLGSAEDVAQVLRVDETVVTPAGTFDHCLVIAEWDPLEPLEYLLTFFAPNIGLVLEIDTRTGERSELVEIHD